MARLMYSSLTVAISTIQPDFNHFQRRRDVPYYDWHNITWPGKCSEKQLIGVAFIVTAVHPLTAMDNGAPCCLSYEYVKSVCANAMTESAQIGTLYLSFEYGSSLRMDVFPQIFLGFWKGTVTGHFGFIYIFTLKKTTPFIERHFQTHPMCEIAQKPHDF